MASKKRGLAEKRAEAVRSKALARKLAGPATPKGSQKDFDALAKAGEEKPKKRGLLDSVVHTISEAPKAAENFVKQAYGQNTKASEPVSDAEYRANQRHNRLVFQQERAARDKKEHDRIENDRFLRVAMANPKMRAELKRAEARHRYFEFEPVPTAAPPKAEHHDNGGGGGGSAGMLGATVFGIGGPSRTAKNVGIAIKEDPIGTAKATLRGGRDTLYALPSGLAAAATTRPDKTVKQIVESYQKSYGGTDAEQVARFKKEGVFDKVLDVTGVLGGGTAALGRVLTPAAKAGALGARAEKLANTARPALRVTGGAAKSQELSPNLFKAAAQVKRDRIRAKADAKAVARADESNPRAVEGLRAQAQRANAKAGDVVEVTPRLSRHARNAQRRGVAKIKTMAVHGLRAEQGRRINQFAARALNGLSKDERRAFYYAATSRVPTDPAKFASHAEFETAVRDSLDGIKQRILSHREENAIPAPTGIGKRTDEVRTIDKLLEQPTAAFTPRLAQTIRDLHSQDIEVGAADPRLSAAQRLHRRYAQVAEDLDLHPGDVTDAPTDLGHRVGVPGLAQGSEFTGDYIRRVQKELDAKGRERPLYFPSEKYATDLEPDYAAHAVGGARAARLPFQYTGKLMRAGLQDTNHRVYLNGLARSIKAKHNWNLIADQFDAHTFKDLRNMPVSQLRAELKRRNIDPKTVAFWHPGVFRRERAAVDNERFGNIEAEDAKFDKVSNEDETRLEALPTALKSSTAGSEQELVALAKNSPELTKGWSVVPKHAYDEIMDATKPSGKYGRGWDIFKAKQSRALLGTANLPWLQFQVASNLTLGTVATKGTVALDLAKQAAWYKGLTPTEREAVDMWTGSGQLHDAGLPRMGAAANSNFIDGYRAFKANPIWDMKIAGKGPSTRQLNPIEAMFRMDRAQNTQFRRALLYHVMSKDAFKAMGENMTAAHKLQARITGILKLAPEEQMKAILANPKLMEKHAQFVDDWLGDWTTYTAAERKVFQRIPMFYGFLRFSTRLLFYTLPVKHPLVMTAWAKLGQLQADELRELGVSGLPWARGKTYYGTDGKKHRQELGAAMADDGQVKSIDWVRANPALNQLTGIKAPQQIFSVLPPVVTAAIDQVISRNLYQNRDWRVDGKPSPHNPSWRDFGLGKRAEIFGDDFATMFYPYRLAENVTQAGPQGDDSTLLSPKPTKYKRADIVKNIKKDIARTESEPHRILKQVVPFVPRFDYDQDAAVQIRNRDKKKPKKTTRFSGAGGSRGSGSGGRIVRGGGSSGRGGG